MHVGVQVQLSSPRMQCDQYAGCDSTATMPTKNLQQCLATGSEQQPAYQRFVVPPQIQVLVRQGEDHMKVCGVEQLRLLLLDPIVLAFAGTHLTASMATRMKLFYGLMPISALIHTHAHLSCSAVRQRINGF